MAATAQHHAAGAATVRTLNAGRICAAVRPLSVATCRASSGQRASAAPGGGNGSASCRWRGDGSHPDRRAYLRSSAPPACGNLTGLHPGNAPALRRAAATAQHQAAGAATVRTLNAGRICAAVRPLSVATCRSCIRATRQRCAGWRQRLIIMPLARRRFAP
ncbi:hypothetical protein [Enterobacter hormaechei]|uniref:hypothetical protein n=2 Tax=Enterobacter cloacae complex TaxID=354276 RepID=UPI003EBAED16